VTPPRIPGPRFYIRYRVYRRDRPRRGAHHCGHRPRRGSFTGRGTAPGLITAWTERQRRSSERVYGQLCPFVDTLGKSSVPAHADSQPLAGISDRLAEHRWQHRLPRPRHHAHGLDLHYLAGQAHLSPGSVPTAHRRSAEWAQAGFWHVFNCAPCAVEHPLSIRVASCGNFRTAGGIGRFPVRLFFFVAVA
jgi:hypothetical protein